MVTNVLWGIYGIAAFILVITYIFSMLALIFNIPFSLICALGGFDKESLEAFQRILISIAAILGSTVMVFLIDSARRLIT